MSAFILPQKKSLVLPCFRFHASPRYSLRLEAAGICPEPLPMPGDAEADSDADPKPDPTLSSKRQSSASHTYLPSFNTALRASPLNAHISLTIGPASNNDPLAYSFSAFDREPAKRLSAPSHRNLFKNHSLSYKQQPALYSAICAHICPTNIARLPCFIQPFNQHFTSDFAQFFSIRK